VEVMDAKRFRQLAAACGFRDKSATQTAINRPPIPG
jgi:hypothetical protein